uniref:Transposase n=1 Tax=Aromatoleum anaerobium TaxID=182180 RepID=A0ABX1PUU4_9RHOO
MSRRTARTEPVEAHRLTPSLTTCAACGQPMPVAYTKTRQLMTRRGLVRLHLHIRRCVQMRCSRFHHPYHPEAEGQWALPGQEFGLDVVVRVGQLRYREHRSCPEIHAQLRQEGVGVGLRSVQNLLTQYDTLLSLALETLPQRTAQLLAQGRMILAIDGLQPDVGHEVLWVVRDVLSGHLLCACSLLSSARAELAALLGEVVAALPVPVAAIVSDGQHSLREAVAAVLPGVPHQLCQFHYLREAARPLWEADRHAKKELKKRVRDVRGLERSAELQTDAASEVVLGYCAAVRSALTDDARPPLTFGGLRLHERLQQIQASLVRLSKKGGRRPH